MQQQTQQGSNLQNRPQPVSPEAKKENDPSSLKTQQAEKNKTGDPRQQPDPKKSREGYTPEEEEEETTTEERKKILASTQQGSTPAQDPRKNQPQTNQQRTDSKSL